MATRHELSPAGAARRRRSRGVASMTERQLQAYLLARETLRGIHGAVFARDGAAAAQATSLRAPPGGASARDG